MTQQGCPRFELAFVSCWYTTPRSAAAHVRRCRDARHGHAGNRTPARGPPSSSAHRHRTRRDVRRRPGRGSLNHLQRRHSSSSTSRPPVAGADRDAITEIGAVKICGGEGCGEFATLVDPGCPIPPEIVTLTGITTAMVSAAPRIGEVLASFLDSPAALSLSPTTHGSTSASWRRRPGATVSTSISGDTVHRCIGQAGTHRRRGAVGSTVGDGRTVRVHHHPTHRALDDARATVDVPHALLERIGNRRGGHLLARIAGLPAARDTGATGQTPFGRPHPRAPGVYLFRGPSQEVLYVGTAVDLRRRVQSYFAGDARPRIAEMVALATHVDHVVCAHDLEAGVRELRLLARPQPGLQPSLHPASTRVVVCLTEERFPDSRCGANSAGTGRLSGVDRVDRTRLATQHRADGRAGADARDGLRSCTDAWDPAMTSIGAGRTTPWVVVWLRPNGRSRCRTTCRASASSRCRTRPVRRRAALARRVGDHRRPCRALRDRGPSPRRARRHGARPGAAQRLRALCSIEQLIVARPGVSGGWRFAVVRHGRLAGAGVSWPGAPPMPVVDAVRAGAQTVVPAPDPLRGTPQRRPPWSTDGSLPPMPALSIPPTDSHCPR